MTIDFPFGSRKLHPEPNFNYQLNRTALWNGGDWDELADAASRISTSADWERELLMLAGKALAERRMENSIAYYRMAEFFMFDDNPEKLNVYRKARALFYDLYADAFESEEIRRDNVPYKSGHLPVWVVLDLFLFLKKAMSTWLQSWLLKM